MKYAYTLCKGVLVISCKVILKYIILDHVYSYHIYLLDYYIHVSPVFLNYLPLISKGIPE